jgi:hypothetical protein
MLVFNGFTASYEVASDAPPRGRTLSYSFPTVSPRRPDVTATIIPRRGDPWGAGFHGWCHPISGIFATPSPDHFLAIAGGHGYLVGAERPEAWLSVPHEILHLHRVPGVPVLLCEGHYEMTAISVGGILWHARLIPYGDVRVHAVTSDAVVCSWYQGGNPDGTDNPWRPFTLDTTTGRMSGDEHIWQDFAHGPVPWA